MRGWQNDADLGTFDGTEDARKDGKRREYLERYPHVYRTAYEKAFLAELAKTCAGCGQEIPETTSEAREALMTEHTGPVDKCWHAGCYVDFLTEGTK